MQNTESAQKWTGRALGCGIHSSAAGRTPRLPSMPGLLSTAVAPSGSSRCFTPVFIAIMPSNRPPANYPAMPSTSLQVEPSIQGTSMEALSE